MPPSAQHEPATAALPPGWVLRRAGNGEIMVSSADGNLVHAADKGGLHARMLFALADALLGQPGADPHGLELDEQLARVESAMNYTQATLSPGNQGTRVGEWVQVHGGRAASAYRQLQVALDELTHVRQQLASSAAGRT